MRTSERGPFLTDVALESEEARWVAEFFACMFADTLQLASALAMAAFRFVIKLVPRAPKIIPHGIVSGNFSNPATRISYRNDVRRDVPHNYVAGTNVFVFFLKPISDSSIFAPYKNHQQ
ncbi:MULTISPECIES: hypothetical protein [Pseudomonas]|jgi:hypothetical protein|uniref:Uncharacterized protein n=1 Tax=Pseudomonas salomonii TaxID=191391 RepID=A0A7Y8GBK6_9PSED|nr:MULTISPECIES: hypothetical protein [Pseudomonas]NWF07166.1 hypothetical protein [Pseudomonas salomonii]